MKIGIFADTYKPQTNGVIYVIDSLKENLEKLGCKVYVICPADSLIPKRDYKFWEFSKKKRILDEIITVPAIKSFIVEDISTTLFIPARLLKKIESLDLDIIQFLSPGQIGMFACYVAKKLNKPLVGMHTTDVFEYFKHYKYAKLLPYFVAPLLPYFLKTSRGQKKSLVKLLNPFSPLAKYFKPYNQNNSLDDKRSEKILKMCLNLLYSSCDATIVVSEKSKNQLLSFGTNDVDFYTIPTGVDEFKKVSQNEIKKFRQKYKISANDKIILYVGRLAPEKNLEMLIPVFEEVQKAFFNTKLVFVGGYYYKAVLEQLAFKSVSKKDIIFTGKIKRQNLNVIYRASNLFVFPSLTDTQGLVLHEASICGLPTVLIDNQVSEVVKNNYNGYIAKNNVKDFAKKIINVLNMSDSKYKEFSNNSIHLAKQFTEIKQTKKIFDIYQRILKRI
jgi:glycosyltransferase involved in cell wall biosynthesis